MRSADCYRRALEVTRATTNRQGELYALYGLGHVYREAALSQYHQACRLATYLGQSDDQARAHDGLAHTYHTLNQHRLARYHWSRALALLTRLGIDHTDDPQTTTSGVRQHLADLDQPSRN